MRGQRVIKLIFVVTQLILDLRSGARARRNFMPVSPEFLDPASLLVDRTPRFVSLRSAVAGCCMLPGDAIDSPPLPAEVVMLSCPSFEYVLKSLKRWR